MVSQSLVDKVRALLIDSFEDSIRIYTQEGTRGWVNEDECRKVILLLREKSPIKIVAPFYGDHLDGVICDQGFSTGSLEYKQIWKQIEEGG